tara:strand:+ start:178 stop:351 length:174 start_codon:yes stop_codon:yes gene_type:complete
MNMNENFLKDTTGISTSSHPCIKISHYKEDKLTKTETYPVTYFLDVGNMKLKKISYN